MKTPPPRKLAIYQAQLERRPETPLGRWEPSHMRVLLDVADALHTLLRGNLDPFTLQTRGYNPNVIGKTGVAQRLLDNLPNCRFWREKLSQWAFDPMLEEFFKLVNDAAHEGHQPAFAVNAALNAVVRRYRAECRSARFVKRSYEHLETFKLRYRTTLEHLLKNAEASEQPQLFCWFLEAPPDLSRDLLRCRAHLTSRRDTWIEELRRTYGALILGGAWKLEIGQPEKIYQTLVLNNISTDETPAFVDAARTVAMELGLILARPEDRPGAGQTYFESGRGITHERIKDRLQRVCCFMVETDQLVAVRRTPSIPTYGLDTWKHGAM